MCSREALRPTLLGSRQPKGQSSCATAIGFLLPPVSSASCREGLVHGVVKHLALIRARMGVVVLTSYHSSRAGCVRVVHLSLAATSPGLCLQGCVAQGAPCKGVRRRAARKVRSGWSVRRQRRSAPCAWRAAVVLPRIRAQPRAEMMGGKLLGSAAQPGAGCGVRCTRSPATGAGCVGAVCEGAVCAADAISAAPPWCSVVVGSAPERGDDDAAFLTDWSCY